MDCTHCALNNQPVLGDGPRKSRITIIGRDPGNVELQTGIPFTGPAGQELDALLALAQLNRSEVYVDNLVACHSPNNRPPPQSAIDACSPRLSFIDSPVVILLGDVVIKSLVGGLSLKANHGLVFQRELWGKERQVVPMYHPAAALHQPALRSVMAEDWTRLPERLRETHVSFTPRKYKRCEGLLLAHPDKELNILAVDTETEYLGALTAPLVSMSVAVGDTVYWMEYSGLDLEGKTVVGHNIRYDYQVLRRENDRRGGHCRGDLSQYGAQLADTMIAAYLTGEASLGLKAIAKRYLNLDMGSIRDLLDKADWALLELWLAGMDAAQELLPKRMQESLAKVMASDDKRRALNRRWRLKELIGEPPEASVKDVAELFPDELMHYGCMDADVTLALWPIFEQKMKDIGVEHLFWNVEMPLVPVLADCERRGLQIDRKEAKRLSHVWKKDMDKLARALVSSIGLENPASPQQVGQAVFKSHEPIAFTPTGLPSTAAWVLERLAEDDPEVQKILDWKKLDTLKNRYLEPWLAIEGRIHPEFNQVRQHGEDAEGATVTGRLSSSSPNFQNIPKRTPEGRAVRSCVVAEEGNILLSFDYRQIEWILMCVGAQDDEALRRYIDDAFDVHTYNAEAMGIDRELGKRSSYWWMNGGQAWKLAQILGCAKQQADLYLQRFEQTYPLLYTWRWEEVAKAKKLGYASTLWGRRRYIPELQVARNAYEYYEAAKLAFNMFPQGTAADIAKLGGVRVGQLLDALGYNTLTTGLIAHVHDEVLIEIPKQDLTKTLACGIIESLQSAGEGLPITLGVDLKVGKSWGNMQEIIVEDLP